MYSLFSLEPSAMSVKSIIVEQIERVARDHGKVLMPLKDDLLLANCGLDSLCFAVLVARLEDALRLDPFAAGKETRFPETLGGLVGIYEDGSR